MQLVIQNMARPGEMLEALKSMANTQITEIRIGAAYTTLSGCKLLFPRLMKKIGEEHWQDVKKTIVTSFDYGLTQPEALEYLTEEAGCEVQIANASVLERSNLHPESAFHSKIFIFDEGGQRSVLVGSANLTEKALTINTEAGHLECRTVDAHMVDVVWSNLLESTEPLSDELLDRYRTSRKIERPAAKPEGEPATVELPKVSSLSWFWEAIRTGAVNPEKYDQFWVEAGSMSSGGSHNQLETPRGANRFFGFDFNDYEDSAVVRIGELTVTRLGRTWDDRRFAWHGDNQMERINLPTSFQGGYDNYQDTAILFRRRPHGVEMEVVPWSSTMSVAWQEASLRTGTLYKAGRNSKRCCGLF